MSASGPAPGHALLAVLLASLVVLGACSPGEVEALRPPPTTRPLTSSTTTTPADYARMELDRVAGRTRTTVTLGPGQARLFGTVIGPDGPVAGATVHVERLVGDAVAEARVSTGADGGWVLADVLGGRYRVRSWRSPDLVLLEPHIFFVEATEARQATMVLERVTRTSSVDSAVAPDPPVVNQEANVVVRASRRIVDERGIVRTVPLAGAPAILAGVGMWAVVTPSPVTTDASGSATWRVVCLGPGSQPLEVTVGAEHFPLSLPPCAG